MKPRILLVEEDEVVLVGLAEGLGREGFEPLCAASAAQALALQARTPADLALSGQVKDEADGLELMRRLRERQPELPFLVIAGEGAAGDVVEALRQGVSDYVQKPARAEEIAHRIRSVLELARLRKASAGRPAPPRREAGRHDPSADRARALRALAGGQIPWMADPMESLRKAALRLARDIRPDDPLRREVQAVESALERFESLAAHLRRIASPRVQPAETSNLSAALRRLLDSEAHAQRLGRHPQTRFAVSGPGRDLFVFGPPEAWTRLLTHLLEAAFFSLPRGGRVWLDARAAQDPDGGAAARLLVGFSLALTGEQLDRAFEPFGFQPELPNAWQRGFLLSDAAALARALHAGLQARPVPQEGSSFILQAPLRPPPGETRAPAAPDGRNEVLLVDDQEGSRAEARGLLEALGYRVEETDSGRKAVELVGARRERGGPPIHLVLMDLVLGEAFDGTEASGALLALDPGLRILLAGGFVETERVAEARRLGVRGYVRKPFDPESLGRAVREAVEEGD